MRFASHCLSRLAPRAGLCSGLLPRLLPCLLASLLWLGLAPAAPAATPAGEAEPLDQVIVPQVLRQPVALPRIPSRDFEVNLMLGTYATQNFGASLVKGLRLGYHLNEDFFAEASYGSTRVSDANYRQVLPGGLLAGGEAGLSYTQLSLGWNVLPGEVFVGSQRALASAVYLIGGLGSTRFDSQRLQTAHAGLGLRVLLGRGFAVRVDMRDHLYELDLLGRRQSTHNLELGSSLSYLF
jgi:outer membrane beta-barrel protein